jgi:hypothetical protein
MVVKPVAKLSEGLDQVRLRIAMVRSAVGDCWRRSDSCNSTRVRIWFPIVAAPLP